MREDLIEILACPVCSGAPLGLVVSKKEESQIIEGELLCPGCSKKFLIKNKIPRMLTEAQDLKTEEKDQNLTEGHFKVRKANVVYHDNAADTYDEDEAEAVHQNEFNQGRIEDIVRDLSRRDGNSFFLDIGCGTGNVLKFGKKYFAKAVGTDVSVNMLKLASNRALEVIQADALFAPFKSETFDVISAFSVLHHIYDYSIVFSQFKRILKKNGTLYTDWDPQKRRNVNIYREKLYGQLYFFLSFSNRIISFFRVKACRNKRYFNLRNEKPELRDLYRLAEYHEQKPEEERGLDFSKVKESLIDNGFIDIEATFHEAGKMFNQLDFRRKIKIFLQSKASDFPKENFLENIQIIARKGVE